MPKYLAIACYKMQKQQNKQILWPLVRKWTIPIERPPLVNEI
jgi:hypothetical protein